MPTSPGITLTATITDPAGVGVAGKIVCTLNNFGGVPPRIAGSNVIANQTETGQASGSGIVSMSIYGNYQLAVSGSYYEIAVYGVGANGTLSNAPNSVGNYQFLAAGTFDLSNLVPIGNIVITAPVIPTGTTGFGNGVTGHLMTTTLQGTGNGPANPQTAVAYESVVIGGITYWRSLFQCLILALSLFTFGRPSQAQTQQINGDYTHSGTETFTGPLTRFSSGLIAYGNLATNPSSSTIDALVTAFGSNQGRIVVLPDYAGANQTVFSNNIIVEDLRNTQVLIGNPAGYTASILFNATNGTGTTNRVFGVGAQAFATAGGTGIVSQGETVGMFAGCVRSGGTRPCWASNTVVQINSGATGNAAIGFETDFNNNSGADAAITNNATDQQYAHDIVSGGANRPQAAFRVTSSSGDANAFLEGLQILNYHTRGIRIVGSATTPGGQLYSVAGANDANCAWTHRNAGDAATVFCVQNTGNIVTSGVVNAVAIVSPTANPAAAGFIRAAHSDTINFRNLANGADLSLSIQDALGNIPNDTFQLNPAATSGLIARFFTDAAASSNVAGSGGFRATNTESAVCWRNNANTTDLCLSKTAADELNYTSTSGAGFRPGSTVFANLGTPANGVLVFCSDCTIANPCATAGSGAMAKRLNGVWVCN